MEYDFLPAPPRKQPSKLLEEKPIQMRSSNQRMEHRGWAESARFARKTPFLRCSS
jgi:hypothetical protein